MNQVVSQPDDVRSVMTPQLVLSEQDAAFMRLYADRLRSEAERLPVRSWLLALICVVFIAYGGKQMLDYMVWLEPQETILDHIDSTPSDADAPPLLVVSGESRKGLYLLELQTSIQVTDAVLASIGFVLLLTGVHGLVIIYSHRHDAKRNLILAKLIRQLADDPQEKA